MLIYRRLHEIVLIELLIGLINMVDIIKNVKISLYEVININEKNMITLLIITFFFFLIFFNKFADDKISLELELILGLGLIGLFVIILSKDLIIFFLAIELYSLSVYLLLFKNDKNKAQITILYFLIGSISSSLLLLGIAILYNYTGSLNIEFILENFEIITNYHYDNNFYLFFGLAIFFFALLFKLGAAPFQYWVIRVYTQMDIKILIYQSIIPKIAYILILLNLFFYLNSSSSLFLLLLLFSSFLSLLLAPVGAITHGVNQFKTILAYSSILHVGFLLLGLAANFQHLKDVVSPKLITANLIEYLVIYGINTIHLFIGFYLLQNNKDSKLSLHKSLFFFSLLISLFSFIGLPPFAGFYAKLNIFINCYNTNNSIFYLAIIFILISTLISSFLYLKFIKFLYFSEFSDHMINSNHSISLGYSNTLYSSYLFSFFSLFLFFYPFFLPFLSPLFDLFSPYF